MNLRNILLMLLLSGVTLVASCSSDSAKFHSDAASLPTVAVARVRRTDLSRSLVLAAEFRPFQEIEVHAKVAGYVKKIYVDVGDRVKAGQLLVTLEIPELRDEVNQAEAAMQQSQEEIRKAKSNIHRYESAYEAAHLAYTRLAGVSQSQPGLVAQQEIDDAQGKDRVAEAQVATAQAALAAAEQQLNVAKANQQRVQSMFAYAQITAPFAGVVTKRYADTGSMIQAGTASETQSEPVVRLSQNDLLRLVIPVPESVVPQIHLHGKVDVRVPVLGKTYEGTVARFADQVDMATRTMHTEVDVPNPKLELVPGEYAEASIILNQERNTLAIPIQGLSRTGENITVLVVNKENKIEERPVRLGIETPDQAEILSGLAENDLVVVGNRSQLRSGMMVQPKVISEMQPSGGN